MSCSCLLANQVDGFLYYFFVQYQPHTLDRRVTNISISYYWRKGCLLQFHWCVFPNGPIYNTRASVQISARCHTGDQFMNQWWLNSLGSHDHNEIKQLVMEYSCESLYYNHAFNPHPPPKMDPFHYRSFVHISNSMKNNSIAVICMTIMWTHAPTLQLSIAFPCTGETIALLNHSPFSLLWVLVGLIGCSCDTV